MKNKIASLSPRLYQFTFAVLLLLLSATAQAEILRDVRINGNHRVHESTILLQVSSKAGEVLDQHTVEKDVRQIYLTGFFDDVGAQLVHQNGGAILIFNVREKPAIRHVYYSGNKVVESETLSEKLNIGARKFLDKRKIQAGIEAAKSYYQTQGYYDSSISYDVQEAEQNQVDLTFTIDEGDKKVIREISFEGNKAFDDDDLTDSIETTTYSWWISWLTGSGVVKEEELDNDVRTLTRYYMSRGYANARVTKPEIRKTDDGLKVVFKVTEGELFNFGRITASGTLLENDTKKTLKGIESKQGDVFNIEFLQKDSFFISEKFTDIGYAFANVDPVTSINQQARLIDIDFTIDKGNIVYIDSINITGNNKTRDNVIRRSLQMEERERFSSSKIRRSQELLQRLGFFEEATITPEPTNVENEVDLNVSVREASTGTFSVGAGVSSGDGFIFSTRVSEVNMFGTGNSLSFNVDTGETRENFVLSWLNPRVNDSYWSFGADALSVERDFDDFKRKQKGGSFNFGYPLWFLGEEALDDVRFDVKYQLLDIDIDDVEDSAAQLVKDQEGKSTASSVIPRLVRNTIDNPIDPVNGSRQVLDVELAGLGGDQKFWLAEASNTWYYPFLETSFGPLVFSQRTSFGWGETFDNEDFPLYRRFFPGGINSVRGYETRELGPTDGEGNEYGGNKELVGNFDMIFPLIPAMGLKGVVFYDIGQAFDDDENIEFSELRLAWGWGIRWRSPLAPIRVEFGYPIDKETGEKSVVTNFSFGAPL